MAGTVSGATPNRVALLRFACYVVGCLPLSIRSRLGWGLGYLFSFIPTKDRKIAKLQMDFFLKDQGGSSILPKVYASLGQTCLEAINLRPLLLTSSTTIEIEGLDQLSASLAQNKGLLALSAHTGNWELLAAYFSNLGYSISTVARQARIGTFQSLISSIRQSYGLTTLWRTNISATKDIIRTFKSKGIIAALIDQDTNVESISLPFLGVPASCPIGLVEFAARLRVPIVITLIFRISHGKYKIYIENIPAQADAQQIITCYNRKLESLLKQYPEQWVWFHKRWRTLDDGTRLNSREYVKYLQAGMCIANQAAKAIAGKSVRLLQSLVMFICCMSMIACKGHFFFNLYKFGDYAHLQQAEEYSRQGKYSEAIEAYRSHMQERLAVKERPDWENPYFYLILIGDIQLGQAEVEQALLSYEQAEKEQVDKSLISDRFRSVASWYEKQGNLKQALEVLKKYRDRDPLLYDAILDRLAKQLVEEEDKKLVK